jgi:hypothetical protein
MHLHAMLRQRIPVNFFACEIFLACHMIVAIGHGLWGGGDSFQTYQVFDGLLQGLKLRGLIVIGSTATNVDLNLHSSAYCIQATGCGKARPGSLTAWMCGPPHDQYHPHAQ